MIRSLIGVFNGTSNYILTRMEEGLSRDDALHEAQAKGYAEADPSDDIDGIDTRNKLIIVTKLGFGVFLRQDQVPIEGMREVALEDVEFAKKNGYSIKLLGVSRLDSDGMMCAYVAPCLVPMSDPLASVRGVFNGIQVYDLLRGLQGMMASGAGSKPTAMAIFTDLINMAREQDILWPASSTADRTLRIAKSRPAANYYVRMNVQNRAGSLAKITKAFGKAGINIGSIEQPPAAGASELPVMVICGPAEEREVRQLIGELGGISEVMGKPVMLRIEASAETSAAEPDGSKKEATTCA
jgi:homoserine dehydrogenase